jgi:SAM-dependent methyltransferase
MIVTLQSNEELRAARATLRRRNLDFSDPRRARLWRLLYRARFRAPLPPADTLKSWDVETALRVVERACPDLATPILDMGCYNSEIVYVLHALGYTAVHGCDLNPLSRWMPYWHAVRYRCADLTRTPYPDSSFGFLTCLSVIEHGVRIDALAAEVSRLLRPGGVFFFTTDFDATGAAHEIDPAFRIFGQEWRIFDPQGLHEVLEILQGSGMTLLEPNRVELSHPEAPVRWNGQNYTFVAVSMVKTPDRRKTDRDQ